MALAASAPSEHRCAAVRCRGFRAALHRVRRRAGCDPRSDRRDRRGQSAVAVIHDHSSLRLCAALASDRRSAPRARGKVGQRRNRCCGLELPRRLMHTRAEQRWTVVLISPRVGSVRQRSLARTRQALPGSNSVVALTFSIPGVAALAPRTLRAAACRGRAAHRGERPPRVWERHESRDISAAFGERLQQRQQFAGLTSTAASGGAASAPAALPSGQGDCAYGERRRCGTVATARWRVMAAAPGAVAKPQRTQRRRAPQRAAAAMTLRWCGQTGSGADRLLARLMTPCDVTVPELPASRVCRPRAIVPKQRAVLQHILLALSLRSR